MLTARDLAPALTRYAVRLHERIGAAHHVASPLGAWLILALMAGAADVDEAGLTDGQLAALADALGLDLPSASSAAKTLLSTRHPAVRAAVATWLDPRVTTPAMAAFLAALPTETGPIPAQEAADTWAQEHTDGLITTFPIDLAAVDPFFVLANALVSRVTWVEPMRSVDAHGLGPGPFATSVRTGLQALPGYGHRLQVEQSALGPVAVHRASDEGLTVVSVSADPEHSPAAVLDTAYRLALRPEPSVAPRDLEPGQGHSFVVEDRNGWVTSPDGIDMSVVGVTIPAWSATSNHDLAELGPELGFGAVGDIVRTLLRRDAADVAVQSAVARFHREGFEAAAVTAYAAARVGIPPQQRPGILRTVRLQFGHPYAVVAVASAGDAREVAGPTQANPWNGIPVFSAWVAEPEDAEDSEDSQKPAASA